MLSSKAKIRLALASVAVISLSTSFLSLSYMNSMAKKIQEIARTDARMAQIAESISLSMLEARREEKNFVIYFDTTYISNNQRIMQQLAAQIDTAMLFAPEYRTELDSISTITAQYNSYVTQLAENYSEDPRALTRLQRQIKNVESQLQIFSEQGKITPDSSDYLSTLSNISLLAAASKLSDDKAQLVFHLRETSTRIVRISQHVAEKARSALLQHSEEGIRYNIKAQRNTLTMLFITAILLLYLVLYFPARIFTPLRRFQRSLQAIGRGETHIKLPEVKSEELMDLAQSFEEAIEKLRYFNELKSQKIGVLERKHRKILEEVDEAVLFLAPDLTISYINSSARALLLDDNVAVPQTLQDIKSLWTVIGEHMKNLEKMGRFEIKSKIQNSGLKKRTIAVIPNISAVDGLESIVVIIS